ncbi:hypothetical protein CA234_03105 [Sphingomonas sp. ABOLE]|uniref:hypothetical protein n=1 Tax=Sphingomonas sp. ABOLE TaxID=1985878 RepID=UPI000F7F4B7B|nr:hypothetical protein [Sphingomonas sp. ABOLE]RSV44418.1 hypothetical protein CA234_03105 [Sphingomonas sp. ABOLE]
MTANVAIRLGTEGKARVVGDFAEIADAGDRTAQRWQRSYERASADVEAAIKRQANAAARLAAAQPQTATQQAFQAAASTNYAGPSARESAEAFRDAAAQQAQLEARTRALLTAIDPTLAAQQRLNTSLAEAKELYEAGAISGARYTQVVRQLNGAAAADAGVGAIGKSAQESASVFSAAFAQMEQRAQALRISLDPAYAAQVRYDREIANARELIRAGAISLDDYVAVLRRERAALNASAESIRRHGTAMAAIAPQAQDFFTQISMGANVFSVLAIQGGQAAGQMIYLEGAAGKFARFMLGPWGLAITAGLLVLGALSSKLFETSDASKRAEEAMADFQKRQSDIKSFIDETTGALKEQNKTLVLNAILARQAQIAENEKSIADSRRKAFDLAGTASLKAAAAAPGTTTSGVSFTDDRDVQRVIREAGGDVDKLSQGLASLAKARPELAKVALGVSSIGGQAILAQRDNERLGKELAALGGDASALAKADTGMIEARAKLAGATTSLERAQAQYTISIKEADAAYDRSKKTQADQKQLLEARTAAERKLNEARDAAKTDRHSESLARNADAMRVNASAGLELAEAYLEGGAAALKAEAARKGLTDATRKGIDADAQVARQLQILVADQLVTSAQGLDQLRAETLARHAANDNVAAGTLLAGDLNRKLSDEAALRPLLRLQLVAQGDALKLLTRIIADYRKALADAHEEEGRGAALAATEAARNRATDYRAAIADLGKDPRAQALAAARRAAESEAANGGYAKGERPTFVEARVNEAAAQYDLQRAQAARQQLLDQEDRIALAQRELQLVGASDAVREGELAKMQLILGAKRDGVAVDSEAFQSLMRNQEALDQINRELDRQRGIWDEIRQTGGRFIDDVLNTDNWKDWGDFGRKIIQDLINDFIRLAAINPLKNALFGENLPTASGVFGRLFGGKGDFASGVGGDPLGLGGLGIVAGEHDYDPKPRNPFGSVGSGVGAVGAGLGIVKSLFSIFGNAVGTENWSGGMMLAGENGPEILYAPRGTRVGNAPETRRALSAANEGNMGVLRVELALTDDLNARIDDRAANVSVEVVRQAAPSIIDASSSATVAQLSRRKI